MKRILVSDLSGKVTFSELYVAFLMKELPRLSSVALFAKDEANKFARYATLKRALAFASERPGLNLEFRVYKGQSLKLCARLWPDGHFFGFDSFEGFPTDGRTDWNQDFSVEQIPDVPDNCTLIQGYFDKTLPTFLMENDTELNFLNIDCDIYSSTVTILNELEKAGKFREGVIIHFDELINYKEFLWNEFFALFEFLINTNRSARWILCHGPVRSVDQTLSLISEQNFPSWAEDKASGYRQQATMILDDNPIDFFELTLPHFRKRVEATARILERITRKIRPDLSDAMIKYL